MVGEFTATATTQVRDDILCVLNLQNPKVMVTGFDRENLYFEVRTGNKDQNLRDCLKEHEGELEARVYNPKTKDMVKNEWLTELVSRHLTYAEVYPAVEITSVLYGGKLYFNLNNCILSFDLETYEVALVKEYNTVYGVRDDNVDFGGKAFSITTKDKADFTVENQSPLLAT